MSSNSDTIFSGLNVLIALLSAVVAAIAIKVQQYYAKKQSDREALTDIFGILNEAHKASEYNIHSAYKVGTLMKNGILNPNNENPVNVVKRNYDQIGAMLSSRLVPDEEYYRLFGVLTVVSYVVLKQHIEQERVTHKFYMAHFTNLAIDCFKFWVKQKNEKKLNITDPNNKTITMEMLGTRIDLPKKRWLR